ncbi:CAP domain-containing protein [Egicoccus sp. AB-alg6-2]|uniref:CAP domain-containing protein n=1 Tax=Egicoccus sp. AB-alg6-2 TaxID=3242692 RepID=UPI00359DC217
MLHSRRPLSLFALLSGLLGLIATLLIASPAPAEAARARSADESAAERHLVAEHNRIRSGASRASLTAASDLTEAARAWSDEMARTGTFVHNPSVGRQICCWTAWGENIAWAGPVDAIGGWKPTADRIMRGWMDSTGHRDNILSSTFDEVGIGISVAANGRMYATAVFRRADGSAKTSSLPTPTVRSGDAACPAGSVPTSGFTDVGRSQTRAVDCLAWWSVAEGTTAHAFSPGGDVTRAQLATFVTRAIERSGGRLPAAPLRFADVDANSSHADAIARLAGAGVVGGFGDGTFRPSATVERDQMASVLVAAAEYRTGQRLRSPSRDWFLDDAGTHERAINQAADAGWTAGDGNGHFGPSQGLQRGHLALFLTRWLDTMVAEHGARLPS